MSVHPSEVESLTSLLEPMLGRPRKIEPLPSGSSGKSYRVEAAGGRFVAKLFDPGAQVLLGPAAQFDLLLELARLDLAPAPVGFDVSADLLITELLEEARGISPAELRAPDRIAQLMSGLRKLHGVEADMPRFSPGACAERYLAAAGAVSRRERARYEELLDLADAIEGDRACLCHNDLIAGNLLFDTHVRFIDFDYAIVAPPVIDLAGLVMLNGFSDDDAARLMDAYFGAEGRCSATEFARVIRLVRLMAHFWSLASAHAGPAVIAQYRIQDD